MRNTSRVPIRRYLSILGKESTRSYKKVVIAQSFLGILDLVGVAIIGVVASLALKGVQSTQPKGRTELVLQTLHVENMSFQSQVIFLSLIAIFFLILKTFMTVILNRKILFFLSKQSAKLSNQLLSKVLASPMLSIQSTSSQEIQFAIGSGVAAIALGIVGTSATVITDLSGLAILVAGLLTIDPFVAVSSILLFGLIGVITYKFTHQKANKLGMSLAQLNVKSQINIQELLGSYREIFVHNRREYYLWKIGNLREKYAITLAEQTFLPNIPKYIVEVSVLIGALAMAGLEFSLHDASHAAASLSIFMVAGSRIAPALLRLQQGLVQIRSNQGLAETSYRLLTSYEDMPNLISANTKPDFNFSGFKANISIANLSFTYPESSAALFNKLNLEIKPGEFVAIAGHSGAGKSTFIDLLLGLHTPQEGTISISGDFPINIINRWPGVIGYVPQNIGLVDGTIKENLALGFDVDFFSAEEYLWALEQAQLLEFVENLPGGLDFNVGEAGSKLSGGQRQRLGIARALLTKPKLLFFDEATSALDSQTELEISQAISNLRGEVTTVMIAHRLSTIMMADKVVYLEKGSILAIGDFESVRRIVPDFEKQAGLQGL